MTDILLEDLLSSPYKAGVDEIINASHVLFSLGPNTTFKDLTLWHFIAAWDTLDWFYFEIGMRKATNDRLGCEKWLGQIYKLDIEHTPDKNGITPMNISKYNRDWPFLQNWLCNKRSQLEQQQLKEKHQVNKEQDSLLLNSAL